MSTMTLLAWMAVVSAVIHVNSGPIGGSSFFICQLSCVLAGMVEAGALETRVDSRWRRPSRFLALVTFLLSVSVRCFYPGA